MFCPNCGKENGTDQNYCRACGLKLDAISQVVAELLPSEEYAALQKRRRMLEKFGVVSLSIAGVLALMTVLFTAALYKLILFGPAALFWSASIALLVFLLLAAVLIGYPKLFMRFEKPDRHDESLSRKTGKLIEGKPFEPVPSVTENTTDLLPRKDNIKRT